MSFAFRTLAVEIVHNQEKYFSIKKTGSDGGGAMLANRRGDFLWLGRETESRYQGGFFEIDCRLLKIIDDICPRDGGGVAGIANNFWNISRRRQNSQEQFFLADGQPCLVYEAGGVRDIDIFLDVREIYSAPRFGRHYRVWAENGMLMASYRQECEPSLPEIFIAVCGDIAKIEIKEEWLCRARPYDRGRNSPPGEEWVFKPAMVRASEFAVAVAPTPAQAIAAARRIWRNLSEIKKEKIQAAGNFSRHFLRPSRNLCGGKNRIARYCAANALNMLLTKQNGSAGLSAGLPWFFQLWLRDEAVSLAGLASFDDASARSILKWQLADLGAAAAGHCADAAGWVFKRAGDFIAEEKLNLREIAAVKRALDCHIGRFSHNMAYGGLAQNDAGQTWMDSLGRAGACIEIQALRLNVYALAVKLAESRKMKTYYSDLEKRLKTKIRKMFFDGARLADRFDLAKNEADFTVRPNIFLAAYVYPGLLSKKEWTSCFDHALERLWLDWGGLATIDKKDPRFTGIHTGQDPRSYHNGDSWFYVNNLAAIVMAAADHRRYVFNIEKIFEASTNDLLWRGAVGCASEVSSANVFAPAGCPNQAWSNATYLELFCELEKRRRL